MDLLLTAGGIGPVRFSYCAEGNTMHVLGDVMTDIVAERQ
jgi:hypothetical protein